MEDKKRDAYLHLMYKAFVEVRLYSAMYYQLNRIGGIHFDGLNSTSI